MMFLLRCLVFLFLLMVFRLLASRVLGRTERLRPTEARELEFHVCFWQASRRLGSIAREQWRLRGLALGSKVLLFASACSRRFAGAFWPWRASIRSTRPIWWRSTRRRTCPPSPTATVTWRPFWTPRTGFGREDTGWTFVGGPRRTQQPFWGRSDVTGERAVAPVCWGRRRL